ncbi:MAG TPA: type II toxin-antitoxin system RelE/ParE family toxin [Terricaulis sp.]|nr:type II toxin-antitoxin system RelE/ParE family toxin [Terricaulis sp.]HRP11238.1 type II toxin-antitoxin system RelE/ParE family toxin [Terricaulis sp.]
MTRELRWSKAARRDLLEIWAWRGRELPERGDRVLDRIEAACMRLARFPELGPPYPRMAPEARKLSIDGYLAFYRVDADAIFIVRVVDQRRLLDAIGFEET